MQQGASASALNRVTGGASTNGGTQSSTGGLALTNQNGIAFRGRANTNFGSLLATSLTISNSNCLDTASPISLSTVTHAAVINSGTVPTLGSSSIHVEF